MLKGDDLIAMLGILDELQEKRSELELIRECGYIQENTDGSKDILAAEFYQSIADAKIGRAHV